MIDFEKTIKIKFELDNVPSIKEAIYTFIDYLENDKAFINCEYQIEFLKKSGDEYLPLQLDDAPEIKSIQHLFFDEVMLSNHIKENSNVSDLLFFTHAFRIKELENDIINAFKAIVKFSRKTNDSADMWIDDMTVFGAEVLFAASLFNPKLAYLFSAYAIPYWDMEHANYIVDYFNILRDKLYDNHFEELLKAICYADNDEIRGVLLGYHWDYGYLEKPVNLKELFTGSPTLFSFFKDTMCERFKEYPYLQYSKRDIDNYPIHSFFKSFAIVSETYDQNNDDMLYDIMEDENTNVIMNKQFVTDTYDNEAMELHQLIEKFIERPLVNNTENAEDDNDDELKEFTLEDWKVLFTNCYENGDKIFDYILNGKNSEIIKEIEPFDLYQKVKDLNLPLLKRFKYFTSEFELVQDYLGEIIDEFFGFFNIQPIDDSTGIISNIKINGKEINGNNIILRTLDVLKKGMTDHIFSPLFYDYIMDYNIISYLDFRKRYDANTSNYLRDLNYLIDETVEELYQIKRIKLRRLYEFILLSRTESLELLKNRTSVNYNYLVLYSYVYEQDALNNINDELTQFALKYINDNWINLFLNIMSDESNMTKDELNDIETYIKGPKQPSKEQIMKMLTQQLSLAKDQSNNVSEEKVLDILRNKLNKDEDITEYEHYVCLEDFEDYYSIMFQPLFSLIKIVSIDLGNKMKRAIKLFISLSPFRTVMLIKRPYYNSFESINEKVNIEYDVNQGINIMIKDKGILTAVDMYNDYKNYDYEKYGKLYLDDEPGFMGSASNKTKIESALKYLKNDIVIEYKKLFSQGATDFFDSTNETAFEKSLQSFVRYNSLNKYNFLKKYFNKHPQFIKKNGSCKELLCQYDFMNLVKKNPITLSKEVMKKTEFSYSKPYVIILTENDKGGWKILRGFSSIQRCIMAEEESKDNDYYLTYTEVYVLDEDKLCQKDINILTMTSEAKHQYVFEKLYKYIIDGKDDFILKELDMFLELERAYYLCRYFTETTVEKRQRMIRLFYAFGCEGLKKIIYDDPLSDLDLLKDMIAIGVTKQDLIDFSVYQGKSDLIQYLLESDDYYEIINKLSINDSLEMIDIAEKTNEWKDLLQLLSNNQSKRVQLAANQKLSTLYPLL